MKVTAEHNARIAKMIFAEVYPHYINKVEKKGRTKTELHQAITWLTGFTDSQLQTLIDDKVTIETFFGKAKLHPCLLYTSPSPRDQRGSRMPSSA